MSGLLRWVHSSSYLIKFFDVFSFVIIPIIIAVQRLDGPLTSQSVNAQEESKQNGRWKKGDYYPEQDSSVRVEYV